MPIASNLTRGAILPGAIDNIAKDLELIFCDITGFGEVDWMEIKAPGDDGIVQRFSGPLVITDLKGRIRTAGGMTFSEYMCTAVRHTDNGIQTLGGKLVGARSRLVELRFDPLTLLEGNDGDLGNEPSPDTSLPTQSEVHVSSKNLSDDSKDSKWNKAIEESEYVEKTGASSVWDEEEEDPRPVRGDVVNHRQFGRCTVSKLDDDHIFLKKPNGRVVQLGLSILNFALQGDDDGVSVFDVQIKRN